MLIQTIKSIKQELLHATRLALKHQHILKVAKGYERILLEGKYIRDISEDLSKWSRDYVKTLENAGVPEALEFARSEYLQRAVRNLQTNRELKDQTSRLVASIFDQIQKPQTDAIAKTAKGFWRESYDMGINSAFESMRIMRKADPGPFEFTLTDEEILSQGDLRAQWLSGHVTDTIVHDSQALVVEEVFVQGTEVHDVMRKLEKLGLSEARAYKIAQTEVQSAIGSARHEMFVRSGVQKKSWLTVGDRRVRPMHSANESAGAIDINAPFPSGAMHVGDGVDAINCRCVEEADLSDPNLVIQPWDGSTSDFSGSSTSVPLSSFVDVPEIRLGGTTGARVIEDAVTGQRYVFKHYSGNYEQAQTEYIANRIYEKMGVKVPKTYLVSHNGQQGVAMEFLDGLEEMGSKGVQTVAQATTNRRAFAVDAYLGNWDVGGLDYDNILWKVGSKKEIYRVDNGGSIFFRATGARKEGWGKEVLELVTMRDQNIANRSAFAMFKDITDDEIAGTIRMMKRHLKPDVLDDIISSAGLSPADEEAYRQILLQRLDYLKDWEKAHRLGKAESAVNFVDDSLSLSDEISLAQKTKGYGGTARVDIDDIEDHNLLLWTEKAPEGDDVTMLRFKLTEDKGKALTADYQAVQVADDVIGDGLKALPDDVYYDDILDSVKSFNYHAEKGHFNELNMAKYNKAQSHRDDLSQILSSTSPSSQKHKMAKKYLEILDEMAHKVDDGVAESTGIFSQHRYKPRAKKPVKVDLDYDIKRTQLTSVDGRFKGGDILRNSDEGIGRVHDVSPLGPTRETIETQITTKSGIKIRVRDWDDRANHYSYNGMVDVEVPKGMDAQKAMEEIGDILKIDMKLAPTLDEEYVYLVKNANAMQDTKSLAILQDTTLRKEQKVKLMKEYWEGKLGKEKFTANYKPFGYLDDSAKVKASGWRKFKRFDIDDADILKEMKGMVLQHGVHDSGALPTMIRESGKLMSTMERARAGIYTTGMSSTADIRTGGAEYLFTRIRKASNTAYSRGIYLKPTVLRRLDGISYDSDYYGEVTKRMLNRRNYNVDGWKSMADYGRNETIFKKEISLISNDVQALVVSDIDEKNAVIKAYQDIGLKKFPDGRELKDVVLTEAEWTLYVEDL